jgi:3-oxoacyl-[acyl-carrier-protein] synthase II
VTSHVWITGVGAVSPGGWTAEETWLSVLEGKPCITALERFPVLPASSKVAGVVPDRARDLPMDRSLSLEFGTAAAREAVAQAGLEVGRQGVDLAIVANHGERRLPSGEGGEQIIGIAELAARIAESVNARRSSAVFGACAGGLQAIGSAFKMLQAGAAGVAVAGGTDGLVREFDYFSFSSLYVMSTRKCRPEEASCPFDARRDGFVLAEGAGFVVLETEQHARSRGARPLAVVEGFGWAQNAYHMFAPPPDGLGPIQAMKGALREAGLEPRDVQYVNAHGTSTQDNDACETMAIRRVFGEHADSVPVSSSKSQLGHAMAASGSIETVICVKAMMASSIPPTINLVEADPACDLDYVPWTARRAALRHVLTNSFGFGGHSTALVLGSP